MLSESTVLSSKCILVTQELAAVTVEDSHESKKYFDLRLLDDPNVTSPAEVHTKQMANNSYSRKIEYKLSKWFFQSAIFFIMAGKGALKC